MKFKINDNSIYEKKLNNEKEIPRAEMHSFHRYYGKLIPAIPSCFIKEFTKKGDLVFDPFSGSGTVAVESKRLNRNFAGVEINPLSVKIGKTKTYSLNYDVLMNLNDKLGKIIDNDIREVTEDEKPYIMNRDHWFKDFVQTDLINIKKDIDDFFDNFDLDIDNKLEYKNFYLLTLSAIIKNVSNADTRHVFPGFSKRMHALEDAGKIHIDVKASFKRAIKSRAKAYKIYDNSDTFIDIIEGDSTNVNLEKYKNKVDLIVTNPPYISSVRYIETLKLEMYWMEIIKNIEEYNELAHKMLGNDKLRKTEYQDLELTHYDEINEEIYKMYSIDVKSAKIISEFFNKMEEVIIKTADLLKSGKKFVMKISDSKMKKQSIKTGEFLTLIAQNNGFILKDVFLDEINNNSRSLTTARNTYSDIITHDYIIIWEKK